MKSIYLTASPFDFMRWGKDGFYKTVEEQYRYAGFDVFIEEVEVVPLEIQGDEVRYLVTAKSFTYNTLPAHTS